MKVLVTGGTGVVGPAAVTALLERGHTVRLFSRRARRDVRQWPGRVEAHPGDVANGDALRGAVAGCDAVLHVAGIVDEAPPAITFERVNVEGTRHVVHAAEVAGVRRMVFVSSLGADCGESAYHRSKRRAEEIVRGFQGSWVIVRPGNVYGPGDGEISLVLKMVRVLPAVPLLGGGDQEFSPLWHEDLGRALAAALERDDVAGRALDLAGPEMTSQTDLLDRFSEITGRAPMRVPVPEFLASLGTKIAGLLGVETPLNAGQLTMIREGNNIPAGRENALELLLDGRPTGLDEGLRRLADAQPEALPDEGIGRLKQKRFRADIAHSRLTAEALYDRFVQRFGELLPLEVSAEPGTPTSLAPGETLTMSLPVRGHIQVRVVEMDRSHHRITLVTLDGHPLAGAVRFLFEPRGDRLRFEVQVFDKAATVIDWIVMSTVGAFAQNANWEETVERVVAESGGTAPAGVESEIVTLDEDEESRIQLWLEELVIDRKREENAGV